MTVNKRGEQQIIAFKLDCFLIGLRTLFDLTGVNEVIVKELSRLLFSLF